MTNLPFELLLASAFFSGFGTLQFKHAEYAKLNFSESVSTINLLSISATLQSLAGLFLLYFHFTKSPLASTAVLAISSLFLSPLIHGFTTVKILGLRNASFLGFLAWPILFIYCYSTITSLVKV